MKNYTILLSMLLTFSAAAQNLSDFIKQNAVDLKSDSLFEQIKDYKCVMVGEMHGTKEAAAFLTDLVKLSSKQGKKIILGLEIPASDMTRFIKKPSTKNLKNTPFFKQGYGDGRNSEAWFQLIEACKKLKNLEFCFFDVEVKNTISFQNRDSLMFENLAKRYRKDTTKVIYVISGNLHSRIKPFRNDKTLGCFMADYLSSNKVMAVNHLYGDGSMYNRSAGELRVRVVKGQTGIFATYSPLENYFLPKLPAGFMEDYSAIFYTKTITASLPIHDNDRF